MTIGGDPLRVLIAGGGVAGLEAALALRALADERVEVELLAPDTEFVYRPLAVAEPFRVGEVVRFPLRICCEAARTRLRQGRLSSVDPDRHVAVTDGGAELSYDVLLLAVGGVARKAIPGALTFRGSQDAAALEEVLTDAREGRVDRLAFALPEGATWPLPLYELALLARMHLVDAGVVGPTVVLVTPEEAPLHLFGQQASEAMRDLLEVRGIELHPNCRPVAYERGRLLLESGEDLSADRVVALPLLEGPPIEGVPQDEDGFVPVGEFGRVEGLDDVYAAGDLVRFPLKQGGLAAQQADAASGAIAASAGAPVSPTPFKPVLRGLLLAGGAPRYLRGESGDAPGGVDTEALWWPPAKIVGRYLAPFLAAHAGIGEVHAGAPELGSVAVDVTLEYGPAGLRPVV